MENVQEVNLLILLANNLYIRSAVIRNQALLKIREANAHRRKALLYSFLLLKYTRTMLRTVWTLVSISGMYRQNL